MCRWFRFFSMPFGAMKSPIHDHFTELQRKIQLLGEFLLFFFSLFGIINLLLVLLVNNTEKFRH